MSISKQIIDREKSSESVQAALQSFRERIVADMGQRFGEAAAAASATLLASLHEKLRADTEAMAKADGAHVAELGNDGIVRAERAEQADGVRRGLLELRELVGTCYGPDAAASLGFSARTPADPTALLRQGRFVLQRLPDWQPPPARFPGTHFDPSYWVERLRSPVERLGTALDGVALEERRAEGTRAAKNRAMSDYDQTFSLVAKLVSALLEAAGEPELAEHLRPSGKRSGRTAAMRKAQATPGSPTQSGSETT